MTDTIDLDQLEQRKRWIKRERLSDPGSAYPIVDVTVPELAALIRAVRAAVELEARSLRYGIPWADEAKELHDALKPFRTDNTVTTPR